MRRSPGLAVCMAIILFSLVGLPPLAGFIAKFAAFAALLDARLLALLAIGGLNTVLSLFYYLRVVRVMVLEGEPADRPAPTIPLALAAGGLCGRADGPPDRALRLLGRPLRLGQRGGLVLHALRKT